MGILDDIRSRKVFFDGGMGSLLQAKGLTAGELPETWNILHSDVVTGIHYDYLTAGCDILTTNTFGANSLKYASEGEFSLENIINAAVDNAKTAVDMAGKGYVALDLGPTGKLLKPFGDLSFEDAYDLYSEVVKIGVKAGVDLILVETMSDGYEAKAAVLAAKENCDLPVFAMMTYDSKGKLLTGGNAETSVALLEGLGVDALGVNCSLGPKQLKGIVSDIVRFSSTPVIVNPNAGLPRSENGNTVYDIDADEFAASMVEIADLGANILGGCCGTTPEHLRKTVELCADIEQVLPEKKNRTVITSYAQAVVIDKDPVIIGERINPTGKKKFKQALIDHDLEYILQEGVKQQEAGAHVLDVNVGLPEIDEPSMMEEVVRELQAIVDIPLQIDTSDIEAMERAMRICNGKPLINSVNGKEESMRLIFPLVKKYGGVVVALTLDEDGIPDSADRRIEIARKIYDTAAEYGIGKEDILVDCLCLTVSADSKGALTTLETVRRVRDELGGKTILGISNISFGLPKREIINASFFTMAMQNGLNAAIINPLSEAMMRSYYSFRALSDLDPQCGDYIEACNTGLIGTLSNNAPVSSAAPASHSAISDTGAGTGMSLKDSIIHGLKERAQAAATEELMSRDPLDVINEDMVPALDIVGKGFEDGTIFLPQLLMSAEAAKAAFDAVKDKMESSGRTQEKKGTIVLATVKGDIHDIGKNIVKVLLENYSFDIIDLGKDVPPEKILQVVIEDNIRLVGLSALMTTTVPSMEETIKLLHRDAPWAKIMVGGAVLTEDYARSIGADRYCRDAMASVEYAEEILNS